MKLLIVSLLLLPTIAGAQVYGFKTMEPRLKVQEQSQIEIVNVPPLLSQDTLGICYANAASVILTAENCRSLSVDCRTISSGQVFSPLGLAPLGRPEDDMSRKSSNLSEGDADPSGGSIALALETILSSGGLSPSEECISLDKILSKVGGAQEASTLQLEIWKNLKTLYDKSKKIPQDCAECLSGFYASAKNEIEENLDVNLSNEALLKAFGKKTYSEFFDRVLISPECKRATKAVVVEKSDKRQVEYYPKAKKSGNYKEAIAVIKNVLNDKRPVGLGNICLDKNPSKSKCENQHAVVIAGYRKICDNKGACLDSVKVLNSWGKSWQNQNDDGWVDAKTLLDRTFYSEATLTWITEKK